MRLNTGALLLLIPVALLLAKTNPFPGQIIEIRSSNGPIEVVGADVDQVQVSDPSHATIHDDKGKVVVSVEGSVTVQVPRRSALDVATSNGPVRLSGVHGRLHLVASNGPIVVEDAGGSEIHARTSNGAIEIGMAPKAGAKITARTSNGRIDCDFEAVTHSAGANFLEGEVAGGGPILDLQTSNAAIRIRGAASNKEAVSSRFTPGEVK